MDSKSLFLNKVYLRKAGIPAEKAQGLVEYAVIILVIALVVIGSLILFGEGLVNYYHQIINQLPFG